MRVRGSDCFGSRGSVVRISPLRTFLRDWLACFAFYALHGAAKPLLHDTFCAKSDARVKAAKKAALPPPARSARIRLRFSGRPTSQQDHVGGACLQSQR